MEFKFEIGDKVIMKSGLKGTIIGRYIREQLIFLRHTTAPNDTNFYELDIAGDSCTYYAAESALYKKHEE